MNEPFQTSGDLVEASLPRLLERGPGHALQAVAVPFGQYATQFREILESRFADADRAVAIQVEKDVYHAGTALTVLHQVALGLCGGDEALREALIPSRTEEAARLKGANEFAAPDGRLLGAAANVLQVIEGHAELGRSIDLEKLRATSSYCELMAEVRDHQQGGVS